MNKGINLLKPEELAVSKPDYFRLNLLRTIALGMLFSISAVSIVLFLLIALSPLPTLQKQEQGALSAIAKFHPDIAKLFIVEDRLNNVQSIITKRNSFDQPLSKIREKMPSSLSVTGLTINKDKVSVTVAGASLADMDKFLKNLVAAADQKKDFSKVILTSFLSDETHSSYILSVDVVAL